MNKIQIVVLAAGYGKRMKGIDLPKVLISFNGRPIIKYLLSAIKESGVCDKPVIVVGHKAEKVKEILGPDYTYVLQAERLGTGHAVAVCRDELQGKADNIMVLYGDHPFVTSGMIRKLAETHLAENKILTMATVRIPDFDGWRQSFQDFGRIARDAGSRVSRIVEKKDATPEELKIKEVNPSYFCFKSDWLWTNLDNIKNDNVQGEYYLTDLTGIAFGQGEEIATVEIEPREALGVNTEKQLDSLRELV